jgi:hypothetical protein
MPRRRTPRVSPSAAADAHFARLLSAGLQGARHGAGYHWKNVLATAHAVTSGRTVRRERLLRRVALFRGKLPLDTRQGLPHALPPEEVLRCIAVQTLSQWDRKKHRDVIQRVADTAEHDLVASIARDALRPRTR